MEDVIWLLVYLTTEFLNYILAYVIIFGESLSKNKKNWSVGVGLILVIHFLILYCYGAYAADASSLFTMIVIPVFLLEIRKKKNFLLYPFVVIGTSVIAISISFLIALVIGVPDYVVRKDNLMISICQGIPTLILLIFYIYRKFKGYKQIQVYLGVSQYVLFYIGAICSFLMLSAIQFISSGGGSESSIKASGFAVSVSCVTFVILCLWQGIIVHRKIELQEQNRMNEKYMELQAEYFRQVLEQDEKMRRFRHDMNAHMVVMNSYCKNGENEELKRYLESVMKESAICDMSIYTGNQGIDAIIKQLVTEAEQKQISIEIEGKLPKETRAAIYDLCTIISNLLKNAVEACEKIEDAKRRMIKMEVASYNTEVFITIKNTINEKVTVKNNCLITSKTDTRNHGLGSGNVKRAVEKYHGNITYQCENGWFIAEVNI